MRFVDSDREREPCYARRFASLGGGKIGVDAKKVGCSVERGGRYEVVRGCFVGGSRVYGERDQRHAGCILFRFQLNYLD